MGPRRVLYLNHTATVSGGELSLLDLLGALPPEVEPVLAAPPGDLPDRARRLGVRVLQAPAFEPSFRLHPWRTPLAGVALARAGLAVRRIARAEGARLIHANSVRAGLVAAAARALGGPPVAVHVRDVLPGGRVAALTRAWLRRRTALVIANSAYTARAFAGAPAGPTSGARNGPAEDLRWGSIRVAVVPSPVDTRRFDPAPPDRAVTRAALDLAPDAFVAVVVAQITRWKNQETAIRALALAGPRVRLLVVGSPKFVAAGTRFDNAAYLRSLHELAEALGVAGRVAFLGERDDVPAILRAADAALVPSLEEPFGRSVIEAMAMGLPVLATSAGGPAEIVSDGVDGFLLDPRDPRAWADRLDALAADPAVGARLGASARRRASDFGLARHVEAVLRAYGLAEAP